MAEKLAAARVKAAEVKRSMKAARLELQKAKPKETAAEKMEKMVLELKAIREYNDSRPPPQPKPDPDPPRPPRVQYQDDYDDHPRRRDSPRRSPRRSPRDESPVRRPRYDRRIPFSTQPARYF